MARRLVGRVCHGGFILVRQIFDRAISGKQRGGFLLRRGRLIGFVARLDLLLRSNPLLWRGVHTSLCKQLWLENSPRRRRTCCLIWQGAPTWTNTSPALSPTTCHSSRVGNYSQGRAAGKGK